MHWNIVSDEQYTHEFNVLLCLTIKFTFYCYLLFMSECMSTVRHYFAFVCKQLMGDHLCG